MKHGDKAKAKAAKAKAAGKKSSGKVAARSKASPRHAAKSPKQASSKNAVVSKSGVAHRGGNGKTRPRGGAVRESGFFSANALCPRTPINSRRSHVKPHAV